MAIGYDRGGSYAVECDPGADSDLLATLRAGDYTPLNGERSAPTTDRHGKVDGDINRNTATMFAVPADLYFDQCPPGVNSRRP